MRTAVGPHPTWVRIRPHLFPAVCPYTGQPASLSRSCLTWKVWIRYFTCYLMEYHSAIGK